VKKGKIEYLDFEVDKLTRSIENVLTGDSFQTDVRHMLKADLKSVTKKQGWLFNWKKELANDAREVYKLTIKENLSIVQGLISIQVKEDHIFLNLIESAPFNIGKKKVYYGVPGNLVAFACKLSFQKGFDGFVSFYAKTRLIEHYKKELLANHIGGNTMIVNTNAAKALIDKYFKE